MNKELCISCSLGLLCTGNGDAVKLRLKFCPRCKKEIVTVMTEDEDYDLFGEKYVQCETERSADFNVPDACTKLKELPPHRLVCSECNKKGLTSQEREWIDEVADKMFGKEKRDDIW